MGRNYNYSQSSYNTHSCTGQHTLACSCPRCCEVRAAAVPIPHVHIWTLSRPAGQWETGFQIRAFRSAGTKFIRWHQARGSGEAKTEIGKDNKEKSKEEGQGRSADGGGGERGQHQLREPLRLQRGRTRGQLAFPRPELDEGFRSSLRCPGLGSPLTNGEQMRALSQ